MKLDDVTEENVNTWLTGHYDDETKSKIEKLLQENPQEVTDAFYTNLSFGTGGLRGIMGVGTNRVNKYTICAATQGLANYIKQQEEKKHAVFIGYDSRNNSRIFAEEAAKVLAGNDIQVYLGKELRPTPWVSFGCRFKHCSAAIMITASHNPPEYNGYKVYWKDGGQVTPPHDRGIIEEVGKIRSLDMIHSVDQITHSKITEVEKEIDEPYFEAITRYQNYPSDNQRYGSSLKVVYSNLHGTGITLIPEALKRWGFTNVLYVESQSEPDGNFPTVTSPNPEEREALQLGIEKLEQYKGDLLVATDPDADRVGVVVLHKGEAHLLNGNQIASICLEHVCHALTQQKKMPDNAVFVKTIGTTELFQSIAQSYEKPCLDVLTGFKYIGEKIEAWEQDPNGKKFIFGGEESYGYLLGTHVRDKDAVISTTLICEAALHMKRQNKTLIDLLHSLYQKHGFHYEKLHSIKFPESKEGKEQMETGMKKLYENPPKSIGDLEIISIEDYQSSIKKNLQTGETETIHLPKSNVLRFWLADGTKLMIRPSGTEPKIKIYCGIILKDFTSIEEAEKLCENKASMLINSLTGILHR